MLFYLIYTSKADNLMAATDLVFLLEQSRRNNQALDITGMLLYMETRFINKLEGRFIQLLEGPEVAVKQIYSRILSDNRHKGIIVLTSGMMIKRLFRDWSMAFRSLNDAELEDVIGFKVLNAALFNQSAFAQSDAAAELLTTFYTMNLNSDNS